MWVHKITITLYRINQNDNWSVELIIITLSSAKIILDSEVQYICKEKIEKHTLTPIYAK